MSKVTICERSRIAPDKCARHRGLPLDVNEFCAEGRSEVANMVASSRARLGVSYRPGWRSLGSVTICEPYPGDEAEHPVPFGRRCRRHPDEDLGEDGFCATGRLEVAALASASTVGQLGPADVGPDLSTWFVYEPAQTLAPNYRVRARTAGEAIRGCSGVAPDEELPEGWRAVSALSQPYDGSWAPTPHEAAELRHRSPFLTESFGKAELSGILRRSQDADRRAFVVTMLRMAAALAKGAADLAEQGRLDKAEDLSRRALEAIEEARSLP